MFFNKTVKTVLQATALSCVAASAQAVTVGGLNFDDNAFADSLVSSTGVWTFGGGASSLEDALVGSTTSDYAYSFTNGSSVTLAFTDNSVVNGAGADLAIFELGTVEVFALMINGITKNYAGADTGQSSGGFALVLAEIDLDDFGIGAGEAINWVKLFPTPTGDDPADFTVVGAINNGDAPIPVIPVPAGLPLLLGALGGLALIRRHQKS